MPISEVRTQIYLEQKQHETLKKKAKERSVSMAQVVREAVAAYLMEDHGDPSHPRISEESYLTDSAWSLLETAEEIGGSEPSADALRLEEELYGPAESTAE